VTVSHSVYFQRFLNFFRVFPELAESAEGSLRTMSRERGRGKGLLNFFCLKIINLKQGPQDTQA
jgi:hypothetical protein